MDVQSIPINRIKPPEIAVRSLADEQKFLDLRASLDEHGLIQPLVVVPEGGDYRLVVGDRRLKAAMTLGWQSIDCVIRSYTPEEVAIIRIHENGEREDPNPLDLATYLRAQMDRFNWTQGQVAAHCGKSAGWVSQLLKLLELDERTQTLVAHGDLSARHGYLAARIPDQQTRQVWAEHWARFGTPTSMAEQQVQSLENDLDRKEAVAAAPPQDVTFPTVQYEEPRCRYCAIEQSRRPLVLRLVCDACDAAILQGIEMAERGET